MRITGGSLNLVASSTQQAYQRDSVTKETWDTRQQAGQASAPAAVGRPESTRPRHVPQASLALEYRPSAGAPVAVGDDPADLESSTGDPLLDSAISLMEMVFGYRFRPVKVELGDSQPTPQVEQPPPSGGGEGGQPARPAVGGEIRFEHVAVREQRLEVAASVSLELDDGTRIEASVSALMEHSERYSSTTTIAWGDAKPKPVDPLLLAVGGGIGDLSNETWTFDINADGKPENLAAPAAGSVLVALDSNGDGQIVDGSEVLGTRTGNAYSELAALDDDGNGWIDEGDAAFANLRVIDSTGATRTLSDVGVGAISTTSVAASYTHGDMGAETGQTHEVGVFVRDNGTLGVATRIDFYT